MIDLERLVIFNELQRNLGYAMRGGKATLKVRRALLYYTLRRFGLDTGPSVRRPQDQQIVLLNREVIQLQGGNLAL